MTIELSDLTSRKGLETAGFVKHEMWLPESGRLRKERQRQSRLVSKAEAATDDMEFIESFMDDV